MVSELRQRRVFRAAALYAVVAFAVLQAADLVFPALRFPDWTLAFTVVLSLLGLPLAMAVAWSYDLTPHGLRQAGGAEPGVRPDFGAPTRGETESVTPRRPSTGSPVPPNSIAVLPFVDMSPGQDQEYLADGIAEEILNVLAKVGRLRVAARTSSFAFRDRRMDVRQIGTELGVAAALEGSIRKVGNHVRVTSQLIDVTSGYHLWSERYDRELNDIFAIQDEIAKSIVQALDVRLAPGECETCRSSTRDARAYDLYLRGRHHFHQLRRTALHYARDTFQQALALDPAYAEAYAGIADASSFLYSYWEHDDANLKRAEAASARALELAPRLTEAHVSRGLALSLSKRHEEAEAEFQRALEGDPQSFDAHYLYARLCWATGRLEEAEGLFVRAAEIRPEDYQSMALLTSVYRALGRAEEADRASAECFERIQRHLALNPGDVRAVYLGAGRFADTGDSARAREWAQRAIAMDPGDSATLYNVACVYAKLGDVSSALDTLAASVKAGFAHREWIENDGDWVMFQDNPRFRQLVEGMS